MQIEEDLKAIRTVDKQKKRSKKKEKLGKETELAEGKRNTVDEATENSNGTETGVKLRSEEKKKKKKKKKRVEKEGENNESTTSWPQEPLETPGDRKRHKKKKERGGKFESLSTEVSAEEGKSFGNSGTKRKSTLSGAGETDSKKRKQNEQEEGASNMAKSSEKAKKVAKDRLNNNVSTSAKRKSADKLKTSLSKGGSERRRVSFSGEDEVFEYDESKLVRGKRFSKEEDQMVRDAVHQYIERNQLGELGLQMVLNCKKHPEVKDCWKEIGAALPWRPYGSVYHRAHTIFERSEKRGFTKEEIEVIRTFHTENGPQWKQLSEILGKQRKHVKDTWRRIRLLNQKKGQWSQDEYQNLFDFVNVDLRIKAFRKRKSDNVMKREDISWEAISDKISTRTMACCCHKWYDQLRSPLVARGVWSDSDDYHLLISLQKQDGCNVEEVDWDNLLEGRSGEVCRLRWDEMVRHIGGHRERTFIEQVDVLTQRYCGDMLQYRFKHQKEKEDEEEEEEEEEE